MKPHTTITFDTFSAFLDAAAEGARLHPKHEGAMKALDPEWSGTHNYPEAAEMARKGWPEGLAMITAAIDMLPRITTTRPIQQAALDVVGDWDMGRVMAGEPECGWVWADSDRDENAPSGRFIKVVCSVGGTSGVAASVFHARGAALVALVDGLERAGHRVQIEIISNAECRASYNNEYTVEFRAIVKGFADPLQLDQIAYATMHQSVLRRHVFCLRATHKAGVTGGSIDTSDRGDIYLGRALDAREGRDWNDPRAVQKWLRDTLTAQGCEIAE